MDLYIKLKIDIITDGREAYVVNERASPKRFGG